ncbi:MAG: hypothetical protein V1492_01700 [Candidatus Micrarchaeota archaeon]
MPSVVIVADERVGLLTDISYILGKEGIRMEGVGIDAAGGKTVISLSVRDPQKAKEVLNKNGFEVVHKGTMVLRLPDYFKKIDEVKRTLANEHIFLKEWKLISGQADKGLVAIWVDKPRKALRLLSDLVITS